MGTLFTRLDLQAQPISVLRQLVSRAYTLHHALATEGVLPKLDRLYLDFNLSETFAPFKSAILSPSGRWLFTISTVADLHDSGALWVWDLLPLTKPRGRRISPYAKCAIPNLTWRVVESRLFCVLGEDPNSLIVVIGARPSDSND